MIKRNSTYEIICWVLFAGYSLRPHWIKVNVLLLFFLFCDFIHLNFRSLHLLATVESSLHLGKLADMLGSKSC